jgi:hypothetical protein
MTGDSAPRFLHIYCDESRQTADRYMVIGGIITAREYEPRFAEAMALYRQSQNMRAEQQYGFAHSPVRNVQAVDSKDSGLIQIADILMGAIGYEMNGAHTRTGAKRSKILLAEYIAQKAGLVNLQQPTPRSQKNFSIWHFHFRNCLQR